MRRRSRVSSWSRSQSQLDRKLIDTIVEGNDDHTFAVEHEEGLVSLQDQLDYEATSFYQLTVRATDTFSGKWADVQLALQVLDVNDNRPQFSQYVFPRPRPSPRPSSAWPPTTATRASTRASPTSC